MYSKSLETDKNHKWRQQHTVTTWLLDAHAVIFIFTLITSDIFKSDPNYVWHVNSI